MKISTAFATMGGQEWTPALPALPAGSPASLAAGIRQDDGSVVIFATVNIDGIKLPAERRSSILRTLQVMAAGIGEANIANVVILADDAAPRRIAAN